MSARRRGSRMPARVLRILREVTHQRRASVLPSARPMFVCLLRWVMLIESASLGRTAFLSPVRLAVESSAHAEDLWNSYRRGHTPARATVQEIGGPGTSIASAGGCIGAIWLKLLKVRVPVW